jgi:hypothetical protein
MSTIRLNVEDKGDAYRTSALIRLALRVLLGRNQWFPLPTIVVCDARLEFLGACNGCHIGIGHDIDDRNTIESDHLLEIDIPAVIAVHVRYRRSKVRPVPVRLEEVAPVRSRRLGRRHMQEDRIGARLEDGVRLSFIDGYRNAKGKVNRLTCCSGRIEGGNWPVAKMRPSKETCKSSERSAGRYCVHTTLVSSHTQITRKETHLGDDEVLRKLGKSNDLIEHFGRFFVKVTSAHELHRVGPQLKKALRSSLVSVRFAQDLRRVDKKTFVARPRTVAHVFLHEEPPPAVIPRKVRFSVALSTPVTRATLVTHPDDPIRVVWVELHHLRTKSVRRLRRSERVPRATCVCGVVELAGGCDQVSAVRRESMMVESEKSLLWGKTIPCVTFVAGLPDRRV